MMTFYSPKINGTAAVSDILCQWNNIKVEVELLEGKQCHLKTCALRKSVSEY